MSHSEATEPAWLSDSAFCQLLGGNRWSSGASRQKDDSNNDMIEPLNRRQWLKATRWFWSKAATTCMLRCIPQHSHFSKGRKESHSVHLTPRTFSFYEIHPCIVSPRQKPRHAVQAVHASRPPWYKCRVTAARSFYCACNSCVIVKVISALHRGALSTGLKTSVWVCLSVCFCFQALFLDLTLILLIAATISIRLLGLGTSRLPTYWNKHTQEQHQSWVLSRGKQLHN